MPTNPPVEELQVTTKANFKGAEKDGQLVKLPSGNVFRVKRSMDMLVMLKAGRIPNPLSGVVQNMVDRGSATPEVEDLEGETLIEAMKFIDKCVVDSVVEPKIAVPPDPEKDETADDYGARLEEWKKGLEDPESPHYNPEAVPLTWVDMDDRMFIFVFAQGFAADLEAFRAETRAVMASASDVTPVPRKARRASGRK